MTEKMGNPQTATTQCSALPRELVSETRGGPLRTHTVPGPLQSYDAVDLSCYPQICIPSKCLGDGDARNPTLIATDLEHTYPKPRAPQVHEVGIFTHIFLERKQLGWLNLFSLVGLWDVKGVACPPQGGRRARTQPQSLICHPGMWPQGGGGYLLISPPSESARGAAWNARSLLLAVVSARSLTGRSPCPAAGARVHLLLFLSQY